MSKIKKLEERITKLELDVCYQQYEIDANQMTSNWHAASRARHIELLSEEIEGLYEILEILEEKVDFLLRNQRMAGCTLGKMAANIDNNERNIDYLADDIEDMFEILEAVCNKSGYVIKRTATEEAKYVIEEKEE